jgi:hypothetical protein
MADQFPEISLRKDDSLRLTDFEFLSSFQYFRAILLAHCIQGSTDGHPGASSSMDVPVLCSALHSSDSIGMRNKNYSKGGSL